MTVQRISRTPALMKALRALERKRVMVGVPEETASRPGDGISIAALGYLFEYGAPEINMPARPHLRPGIQRVTAQIRTVMRAGAKAAVAGKPEAGEQALTKVGLLAVNSVRGLITAGIAPPLAPSTIRVRQHRKSGARTASSTTPLVDTGAYRQSITYVVK